jgi:hypothetical protein
VDRGGAAKEGNIGATAATADLVPAGTCSKRAGSAAWT